MKKIAASLSESTRTTLFSKLALTQRLLSLTEPAAHGDWTFFVDPIDPEFKWMKADSTYDTTSLSGTYVGASTPKLFSTTNTSCTESPEAVGSSCGCNDPGWRVR